jgi:hypothetical protein
MERAGNEAGVPTAPKSYGNTIRVWKMSWLKNLTFNVSVVQPSVLLQDSIGVTSQRRYVEQGEIGIQTSCFELQRYKNYVTQSLTYDDTILLPQPRTPRHSTGPIALHLPEKHKSHNLAQHKHNLSARSLLPLINYLEHYVILRCSCLEPNAS